MPKSLHICSSGPLEEPTHLTSKPSLKSISLNLFAGNTCPPVPPAQIIIFLFLSDIFFRQKLCSKSLSQFLFFELKQLKQR